MDTLEGAHGADKFAPSSITSEPVNIDIKDQDGNILRVTLFASRSEEVSEQAFVIYKLIGYYFLKYLSEESYLSRFHTPKPINESLKIIVDRFSSRPHIQVFGFADESPYVTPSEEEVKQLQSEWPESMTIDENGHKNNVLPLPLVMASVIPLKTVEQEDGLTAYSILAEVSLTVNDDYQKMGLGMTILKYAIEQAKQEGIKYLYANIDKNPGSARLFIKLAEAGLIEKIEIDNSDSTDNYYHIIGTDEDPLELDSIIIGKPKQKTVVGQDGDDDHDKGPNPILNSLKGLPKLAKGMGLIAVNNIFNRLHNDE